MTYIKGFDGLRAVSIAFVLLTHLGLYYQFNDNLFLKKNFSLVSGNAGVMIFFTISGFLITLLLLNEKKKLGVINFKLFFIRRFLRLLPPLLLFFTAIIILMFYNYLPEHYDAVLISFFYLFNFVPLTHYTSELGHTWSLAVEEQFYFMWPFILNGLKKIKGVIWFASFLILVSMIVKAFYRTPFLYEGQSYHLFDHFFPDRWFIPACLPIMMGSLTAIVLFYKESFLKSVIGMKFLVASIGLYSIQLIFSNLSYVIIETLQPLAVSLLLLWIYFNQTSYLVQILELKPILFIGKISYGLYVYQGLFLRTSPGGDLWIQKFPNNIILVFATAICSYYLIEKPILNYKTRFKISQ